MHFIGHPLPLLVKGFFFFGLQPCLYLLHLFFVFVGIIVASITYVSLVHIMCFFQLFLIPLHDLLNFRFKSLDRLRANFRSFVFFPLLAPHFFWGLPRILVLFQLKGEPPFIAPPVFFHLVLLFNHGFDFGTELLLVFKQVLDHAHLLL